MQALIIYRSHSPLIGDENYSVDFARESYRLPSQL